MRFTLGILRSQRSSHRDVQERSQALLWEQSLTGVASSRRRPVRAEAVPSERGPARSDANATGTYGPRAQRAEEPRREGGAMVANLCRKTRAVGEHPRGTTPAGRP